MEARNQMKTNKSSKTKFLVAAWKVKGVRGLTWLMEEDLEVVMEVATEADIEKYLYERSKLYVYIYFVIDENYNIS